MRIYRLPVFVVTDQVPAEFFRRRMNPERVVGGMNVVEYWIGVERSVSVTALRYSKYYFAGDKRNPKSEQYGYYGKKGVFCLNCFHAFHRRISPLPERGAIEMKRLSQRQIVVPAAAFGVAEREMDRSQQRIETQKYAARRDPVFEF